MSKSKIEAFLEAFTGAHADMAESVEATPNYAVIVVKNEAFLETAKVLKEEYKVDIPISAGGIDFPEEDKMQMMYYLSSSETRFQLIYKVNITRDNPSLPSLTQVWKGIDFHERETMEMFGINFEDHPNLIPLLLPFDWKGGYPLRKDFKGEGVE